MTGKFLKILGIFQNVRFSYYRNLEFSYYRNLEFFKMVYFHAIEI